MDQFKTSLGRRIFAGLPVPVFLLMFLLSGTVWAADVKERLKTVKACLEEGQGPERPAAAASKIFVDPQIRQEAFIREKQAWEDLVNRQYGRTDFNPLFQQKDIRRLKR